MKKLLSVLLVITMMCSFAFTVSASETATTIASAEEFQTKMAASGSFKLTADITLSVGFLETFTGTFDGDGHTITLGSADTVATQGVFKILGDGALVKNLTVEGSVNSTTHLGAFANEAASGASVSFENCINLADVTTTGKDQRVGGILGSGYGSGAVSFTNCSNYGRIIAPNWGNSAAGGIAGIASNVTATQCTNYGTINSGIAKRSGGIIGWAYQVTNVSNCANFGNVNNGVLGGGIIGDLGYESGTITNCFNGGTAMSGIVDVTTKNAITISNCVNAGTCTNAVVKTLASGATVSNCYYLTGSGVDATSSTVKSEAELKEITIDGFVKGDYDYPLPEGVSYVTEEDLKNEVITINTADDFKNIASNLSASYILAEDITLDETYTPISNFSGILDGDGHTIDIGYRVDGRNGLFNTISGGTVKNLSVKGNILLGGYAGGFAATVPEGATAEFINCKNYVTVAISGAYYAGGFVGYSYKSGAVTFTNCNNYANISAGTNANVAGFVGLGSGPSFTGCANYGNITVATGSKFGGGFMGYIYGVVALDNCANFGDIVNSAGGTSMGAIAGGVGGYGSAINATNFVNAGAAYNGISGNFAATRSTATVNKFINVGATTNVIAPSTLSVVTATDAYYLADSGAGFTGATVKTKDELSTLNLAGFTVLSDVYNIYYPVPSELTLTTNTVTVDKTGDGTVTPNTESGVIKVLYNDDITFTVTPAENCILNSFAHNNKEISLTGSKYTITKVIAPSVLDVVFVNLSDIDVNDGLHFAKVYTTVPADNGYYGGNGAKIAFAKAVNVNPFTVTECGLLVDIENTLSDSEFVYGADNVTKIVFEPSDTVKIAPDGSFGILIYNNSKTAGKTLKARAYAKYSNGDIAYTTPVEMTFDEI